MSSPVVQMALAIIATLLTTQALGAPPPAGNNGPKQNNSMLVQGSNKANLTFVVSGIDLPSQDAKSENDAFVKVYVLTGDAGEETRIGTSEVVHDSASPFWPTVFWFNWNRGTRQKIHLVVRDHDTLAKDDPVGEAWIDADQFVAHNQDAKIQLSDGGQVRLLGTQPFLFKVFAKNIPHRDNYDGKSDPFVDIFWRQGSGEEYPVGRTAVIHDEENPNWEETIEFSAYRYGTQQSLVFKIYDYDAFSKNDFIGTVVLDVDSFIIRRSTKTIDITAEDGQPMQTAGSSHPTLGITPLL